VGKEAREQRRSKRISRHTELEVYRLAFDLAMKLFEVSKGFPPEERYSLTDQMRKASRSVCSNIAEAWRKRRYQAAFVSKLNDSEGEAAESQVWIQFAVTCSCLPAEKGRELYSAYEHVLGKLVQMINRPEDWVLP
jgi:four helix bundle protein